MHDSGAYPGGNAARFPETRRSVLLDIAADEPAIRSRAFETVLSIYWRPVYTYLRLRWKESNEDAKDLTQGFFARAMEKEFFEGYDPAKARFRTFLRTCLDGFVANEKKAARRVKRGGGVELLPMDFETAEGEIRQREIASGESPEDAFHKEWVRSLFSLAVAELRQECGQNGRQLAFDIFESYDLSQGLRPTYREIASELGISTTTVTNSLAAMRRDFRHIVLLKLREITATEQEFRREARAVLGIEV